MDDVNLRSGVCAAVGMAGSAVWWRISTGEARYLVLLLGLFVVGVFACVLFQDLADPMLTIPSISLVQKVISDGAAIMAGACLFNVVAYMGDMFLATAAYNFAVAKHAQTYARLNIGGLACASGIAAIVGQYFNKKPQANWIGPALVLIGLLAIALVRLLR